MWEISEGDTKILYAMKLVPPKDVGFWEFKVLKCQKLSMQAFFNFLVLEDASGVSGIN